MNKSPVIIKKKESKEKMIGKIMLENGNKNQQ
jgi:hypothetical protein